MKTLIASGLLAAGLAALAAPAQAQITWTGSALTVAGNRENGCNLSVIEASHWGHARNSVQIVVANQAATMAYTTIIARLATNEGEKFGIVRGRIPPNAQATLTGFHPNMTMMWGTTLNLQFRGCSS